jgi:hypothetical protein
MSSRIVNSSPLLQSTNRAAKSSGKPDGVTEDFPPRPDDFVASSVQCEGETNNGSHAAAAVKGEAVKFVATTGGRIAR